MATETKKCAACGEAVTVNMPYEFKERHYNCPKRNQPSGDTCPKCSQPMIYKLGKYQVFRSCSKWPACDGKINAPRGKGAPKEKIPVPAKTFKPNDRIRAIRDSQGYVVSSSNHKSAICKAGEVYICVDSPYLNGEHPLPIESHGWHDPANFQLESDPWPLPEETPNEETQDMPKPKDGDPGPALYQLIKPYLARDLPNVSGIDQKVNKAIELCIKSAEDRAAEIALKVALDNLPPRESIIKIEQIDSDGLPKYNEMKNPHKSLADMLRRYQAGFRNFFLVGPAGSGKSTLGEHFAQALNRTFGVIGITAGISESRFVSRTTPNFLTGQEVFNTNDFLQAYVTGQTYMIDEVDRGDANTMIIFNPITANGHLPVASPDWPVAIRHPDTVIVFTANTYGTGPDRMYVGANQLDAAFLDRFEGAVIEVDYDKDLEKNLVAGLDHGKEICERVWAIREKVQAYKLRRIVGTRKIIAIAKLVNGAGFTVDEAIRDTCKSWTKDEQSKCGI